MSKELLTKFNEVLRPYYAELTRPGVGDVAALQQYLDRFYQDESITNLLRELFPNFNELLSLFNDKEGQMLSHYFKVRLFKEAIAASLGYNVLEHWHHAQSLIAWEQEKSTQWGKSLNNAKDGFELNNLIELLTYAEALALENPYRLPPVAPANAANSATGAANSAAGSGKSAKNGKAGKGQSNASAATAGGSLADINFDSASLLFLEHSPDYKNYLGLGFSPWTVQEITSSAAFLKLKKEQGLQNAALKAFLHHSSGFKFFYDAQGNLHQSNLPIPGSPYKDFYVSTSLADFTKQAHATALKFNLLENNLHFFKKSDMISYQKKNPCAIITSVSYQTTGLKRGANFHVENLFKDVPLMIEFIKYMKNEFSNYALELQYEAREAARLQLVFTPA